jgi:hypothetical protein
MNRLSCHGSEVSLVDLLLLLLLHRKVDEPLFGLDNIEK